jgi:putative zinc- or iron-chelating protein
MLDRERRQCSIYADRPLCCRLFPLDLLAINNRLQWALSNQCPDDRKRFEETQGLNSRLGSGVVAQIASSLNPHLDKADIAFFQKKEVVANRVEILESGQDDWLPIADCATGELGGETK